jgi:hypothetical protein
MERNYESACKTAGQLYGNLLQRESDSDGFEHAVACITDGSATVRALVRAICVSDEFREKHVMNQTSNELARRLMINMLGDRRPDARRVKLLSLQLLERDWRQVVAEVIDSELYTTAYGDDLVPAWS